MCAPRKRLVTQAVVICTLNKGGLLKRAALGRKKSAGAYRALSPLASLRFA